MQLDLFADNGITLDETAETTGTSTPIHAPASAVETMADVIAWCEAAGNLRYAKAVRRMARAASNTHPKQIPATETALAQYMPSSYDNPYPAEYKNTKLYMEQRRCVQAALRGALGYYEKKNQLRARKDAWAVLLDAVKPYFDTDSFFDPRSFHTISALADACRLIDIEPKEFGNMDRLLELDATATDGNQRSTWQRGVKKLIELQDVAPEVAHLLPPRILSLTFARKTQNALPDHIEADIASFVEAASHKGIDKTSGRKIEERSESTRRSYTSALRYFLTTLSKTGLPIHQLNRLGSVLTDENIVEAARWIENNSDESDSINNTTAASYFGAVVIVAARNGIDVSEMAKTVKRSQYLAQGRAMSSEMCGSTKRICERVISDIETKRVFYSFHLTFRRKAEDVLRAAGGHFRALAGEERRLYVMFGVLAAFCAIQTEGAPERKMSVLRLRVRGKDANIWMPNNLTNLWKMKLSAVDTKSKTGRPKTEVLEEGSQTLTWYYQNVRPLLEDDDSPSIYLFPGIERDGHMLGQTFDSWIKRGTAEAGLRMTAHKFRCIQASILLADDWNNLALAAHLLGNTPSTCATYYGWIDEDAQMALGQAVRSKLKPAALREEEVTYE